ncbi:PD40 domain-containing protein [bacterium]|nr:PD40 domain-containing protein [bacterium]
MKRKDFTKLNLGNRERLTGGLTDHEHPVVSPDGQWVAHYSGEYGSLCVIVTDRRGRFGRRASPHGGNNTQPAWDPTGKRVAYRHQPDTEHNWEIWETVLLPQAQPELVLGDARWNYKHPSYHPTAARLAYFSDEGSAEIYHLWELDRTTGQCRQLTFGDSQNHCHPVYSPDGARIAFHAYEGVDQREPAVTNLYELTLEDGATRQLTSGEDQYKHPFYLTNDVITYHHERNTDGLRWLEAMHLKSGDLIQLTSGKNNDKHPHPWQAKGRYYLAWSSKRLGPELEDEPATYDIFVAELKC